MSVVYDGKDCQVMKLASTHTLTAAREGRGTILLFDVLYLVVQVGPFTVLRPLLTLYFCIAPASLDVVILEAVVNIRILFLPISTSPLFFP